MALCGAALACSSAFLPMQGDRLLISHPDGKWQRRVQALEGKTLRVQWERTGGFAGMRMAATIDSEALSQEEARRLRELVEAAGFFELPEEIAGPAEGADRFLYTLTVEMEGRRHTVRTSEAAAPPGLRSLIRWLTNAARKGRRSGGAP
ncbi:MAG: protealysin inhibitor emfourin [Nitrospinota bacterium]